MAHSDYPLQALLYTVVLHRFLRWRLPDYDPEPTSAACSTSTSAACAGRTPRSSTGAVRRVRVAAAGGAGRGAVRPARRTGGDVMSELFEPVDEPTRALRADRAGLLAAVNAAGVITAADVHIATTLGRARRRERRRAARHGARRLGPCGTARSAWSSPP